ncbi:hypothetical protein ACIPX0_49020 [Streptomyces sp. NPDC090075]|uniref:hypothetical protein n=1 Tax=Streptomyces sp. NPDC090075 TaxID=3365937 RepID=UPI003803E64A
MRLAGGHVAVRRIWTVQLRSRAGTPRLVCTRCTPHAAPLGAASARSAALAHLACHARTDVLPGHLRICQCRERGCSWHPRHRGCAGPVLLALTRDHSGRTWRLADACAACAAATSHTAIVPDTVLGPRRPRPSSCPSAPTPVKPRSASEEPLRVREMLTYLATALPRFTSPGARLLALQCALRANTHGRLRVPHGLLRAMRLRGHTDLWQELAQAHWLHLPDLKSAPVKVQLRDVTLLDHAPGRRTRCHAAHWALHPAPLALQATAPPAVRLTALVLAAHPSAHDGRGVDLDVLARLCGHSPQQTGELLDRLVAGRTLSAWHHQRDTDEVHWQPAPPPLSPPRHDEHHG